MSPGLFQDFMVFVPGVTQGMGTQGQRKISSCCFGVNHENQEAGEVRDSLVQRQWWEGSPQTFFVL